MTVVFSRCFLLLVFLTAATVGFGQSKSGNPGISINTDGDITADAVAGAGGVTIFAPIANHPEGATFDAIFRISNVNGFGIISYQMDIHYVPSILQFNGCSTAGTISSGGIITCNGTVDGLVEMVWTSTMPLANDGDGAPSNLFKVNFTAQGTLGSSTPVTFSEVQVQEFAVPAVATPGLIAIGGTTAADVLVGGRVLDGSGRGVAKARLALIGGDGIPRYALTNGFGYYRFSDVTANETYLLTVASKRFTYAPKTIAPGEDAFDVDFVPGQ